MTNSKFKKIYFCCVGFKSEETRSIGKDTSALMFFSAGSDTKIEFIRLLLSLFEEWEFEPKFIENIVTLEKAVSSGECSNNHYKEILEAELLEDSSSSSVCYWYAGGDSFADEDD